MRSSDEVPEQQNSTCPWEVESRLITGIIMFQPCWKGKQVDQERLWVLSFITRKKTEKTNGKEPSGQEQRAASLAAVGLGGQVTHSPVPSHSQQSEAALVQVTCSNWGLACPVQSGKSLRKTLISLWARKRPTLCSKVEPKGAVLCVIPLAPPWVPGMLLTSSGMKHCTWS